MKNILNSEKEDFDFVINNALLDVKPIKLRCNIAEKLLEHYNNLRNRIKALEQENHFKDCQIKEQPKQIIDEIREFLFQYSYVTNDYSLGEIIIDTQKIKRFLDNLLKEYE